MEYRALSNLTIVSHQGDKVRVRVKARVRAIVRVRVSGNVRERERMKRY